MTTRSDKNEENIDGYHCDELSTEQININDENNEKINKHHPPPYRSHNVQPPPYRSHINHGDEPLINGGVFTPITLDYEYWLHVPDVMSQWQHYNDYAAMQAYFPGSHPYSRNGFRKYLHDKIDRKKEHR